MSKRLAILSEYDRVQAIKRHPEFRRELAAWKNLFERERKPDYRPTQEDLDRNYGPRSLLSREAEMEASRYQMLSLAERWQAAMMEDPVIAAFRTIMPKDGPAEVTVTIPLNQPVGRSLRMVERVLNFCRERDGIADTQPLKPTEVSPWFAWDEHVENKKPLLRIAQELTGSNAHSEENPVVKAAYKRVKRALERAKRIMTMIEPN